MEAQGGEGLLGLLPALDNKVLTLSCRHFGKQALTGGQISGDDLLPPFLVCLLC